MNFDALAEQVSRWTAARTTRRGFLARSGRVAVLVAAGPTLATVLADAAEARVCGQSGYAPKCSTYDCDETWGWCWYATGCCAGGALKKICDCCAPNTPHPVGYCPSGTRVKCIVESCGADPRVMPRPLTRLRSDDPIELSVAVSRARFTDPVPTAVLGDAASAEWSSLAAATAGVVAGPVLLTARERLSDAVAAELHRLRVEFVTLVGPRIDAAVELALAADGVTVDRVGTADSIEDASAEIATWNRSLTGARSAVVVLPGLGERALSAAASLAHARRLPLLVGTGDRVRAALLAPRPVHHTFVVSDDASAARDFPGGVPVVGDTPVAIAAAVAALAVQRFGVGRMLALVRADALGTAAAMAAVPGALLLHEPGSVDDVQAWLLAHRGSVERAFAAGTDITDDVAYDVQSLLNEFEAHLLIGKSGEGLPVISQPPSERPIGKARP